MDTDRKEKERVLVIGIDGATFDVIDPMIAQGKLPNLRRLMEQGTRGELESTIPANSFPGWTSCVTGVNPGKHGIFYSLIRQPNSYLLKVMNSHDVRARAIWEILEEHGRRSGVLNIPTCYPPTPINGVMVTGMLTPGLENSWTYPEELKTELLAAIGDYVLDVPIRDDQKREIVPRLHYALERRADAVKYLMKRSDWDFFMFVLTETDRAQHLYWASMDETHPLHEKAEPHLYREVIPSVYEHCDRIVGEVLSETDERTRVLVVSDHGFAPQYKTFFINRWLERQGFLAVKEVTPLAEIKEKFARRLRRLTKGRFKSGYVSKWAGKIEYENTYLDQIDWSRTSVYFTQHGGVRVNLKGRDPHGIVSPGAEYESLVNRLKAALQTITYPDTDRPIFESVKSKEEVFHGPHVESAPDLVMIGKEGCKLAVNLNREELFIDHARGGHSPMGILIAKGPGIAQGATVKGARLMDVAPTALYMLDEPLTEDMDGAVVEGIFEPEFIACRTIRREGRSQWDGATGYSFSAGEQTELEERLRGLGYL